MQVCISPYSGAFDDQIIELILGIQTKEFEIPISISDQPDLSNIASFYQRGAGNFWIATYDSQVVGTVALIDIGQQRGVLRKMFVAPDFRGKVRGIAQNLLRAVIRWAKSHGMSEIILGTTSKYHAAQRFYEKNGFEEIAVEELPLEFPRMAVDSRFYRLHFES